MEYWKTVVPFRYKFIRSKLKGKQVQCLDVGCGNNSPIIFKYWFDSAIYHGIDNVPSDELLEKNLPIDRYFQKDLERDQLDDVPDSGYDAVVFSHVIEHLDQGLEALKRISHKVRPGGYIFVETPSLRTLSLPHADGFLHFHDDATHRKLYDLKEIANTLLEEGFQIVKGGTRRDPVGIFILGPAALLFNVYYFARNRAIYGLPLWDLLGVSIFILARKVQEPD